MTHQNGDNLSADLSEELLSSDFDFLTYFTEKRLRIIRLK